MLMDIEKIKIHLIRENNFKILDETTLLFNHLN
jgi:hypothetical protein